MMPIVLSTENRVGVIGYPVSHSLSPAMHNAAFAALGMKDWRYDLLPIPGDILSKSLRTLRDEGGYMGLNVTVPHKQAVMEFVNPDDIAQAVGAVNTIHFRRNNFATNTDVAGVIDDLRANDVALEGAKAVVLGAGGAARAAVYGLVQAGAAVTVVNRTRNKALDMVKDLGVDVPVLNVAGAARQGADLIVNCTPLGMMGSYEGLSAWPEDVPLPEGVTVYDMVYRPRFTPLMRQAEAVGGRAIGGLGMLVRQGAAAFKIWTGKNAPVDVMFEAAEAELAKSR